MTIGPTLADGEWAGKWPSVWMTFESMLKANLGQLEMLLRARRREPAVRGPGTFTGSLRLLASFSGLFCSG